MKLNIKILNVIIRSLIIFIFLFHFSCGLSQHLYFSGIPISGTISEFQAKLASKGFKCNKTKSRTALIGQRIYNGKFRGYNSELIVFYNRNSKVVYKVEVTIESKQQSVIQGLLNKTMCEIEHKYNFRTEHQTGISTDLHFKYYIYPSINNSSYIGTISLTPSYVFDVPNKMNSINDMKISSYIIYFVYEDALSSSLNKPSETEPVSSVNFSCGKPENFDNYQNWAANYLKNGCYGRCIYYLNMLLDYYKYGCFPQNANINVEMLDNTILTLRNHQIGIVKTAYSDEYARVFRINDDNGDLKYIEFDECSDIYHVKQYLCDITRTISALKSLKSLYHQKILSLEGRHLPDYWKEDINLSIPVTIGEEQYGRGFGELKWKEYELTLQFCIFKKKELHVVARFDGCKDIFHFCNENEIENYLKFLEAI